MKRRYQSAYLNPLYWNAVIWSVILVLYSMRWINLYKPLDFKTLTFFIYVITISIIFGYILFKIKRKEAVEDFYNVQVFKKNRLIAIVLFILLMLEKYL